MCVVCGVGGDVGVEEGGGVSDCVWCVGSVVMLVWRRIAVLWVVYVCVCVGGGACVCVLCGGETRSARRTSPGDLVAEPAQIAMGTRPACRYCGWERKKG